MDFIGIIVEAGLILIFLMFWVMSNTDQMQHKRKMILFFLLIVYIVLFTFEFILELYPKMLLLGGLISITNLAEAIDGLQTISDKKTLKKYWIYAGISSCMMILNFIVHFIVLEDVLKSRILYPELYF